MRFTRAQYEEVLANIKDAMLQLEPDGRCCTICHDTGHMAWECGRNPLLAMAMCEQIAQHSEQLHETLHSLAGHNFSMGVQTGPARIIVPDGKP